MGSSFPSSEEGKGNMGVGNMAEGNMAEGKGMEGGLCNMVGEGNMV